MSTLVERLDEALQLRGKEYRDWKRFFGRGTSLLKVFLSSKASATPELQEYLVQTLETLNENLESLDQMIPKIKEAKNALVSARTPTVRHSAARRRKAQNIARAEAALIESQKLFHSHIPLVQESLRRAENALHPFRAYRSVIVKHDEWCDEGWEEYPSAMQGFLEEIEASKSLDVFIKVESYWYPSTEGYLVSNEELIDETEKNIELLASLKRKFTDILLKNSKKT